MKGPAVFGGGRLFRVATPAHGLENCAYGYGAVARWVPPTMDGDDLIVAAFVERQQLTGLASPASIRTRGG